MTVIELTVQSLDTLNKDSYIRPEFIVENDNPEKITTYSNMDTFEFSVSKSMLEDKLSQQ